MGTHRQTHNLQAKVRKKERGEGGRREGNISKRGSRKEEKREKIIG